MMDSAQNNSHAHCYVQSAEMFINTWFIYIKPNVRYVIYCAIAPQH
jgi:hypothetical protein